MTGTDQVLSAVRQDAERGDADAQAVLGLNYLSGQGGCPQDTAEAVAWFRRAAEQGDPDDQYNMGILYAAGFNGMLPPDPSLAVTWYRKAAKQGHVGAQYNLGVAYQEGMGVPQDDVIALEWYHKAAEKGYARAQYNLGVAYSRGIGFPQNDVQAVEWWQRAAHDHPEADPECGWIALAPNRMFKRGLGDPGHTDRGYADAQFQLGRMYTIGRGVPRDKVKAIEWFRKAADQGHIDAQSALTLRVWKRSLLFLFSAIVVTVLLVIAS